MTQTRRVAFMAIATVLLASLAATAGAQHVARGILFRTGETLVTELTPAGDVDTFVFYGVAGVEVSFTLKPKSGGIEPTLTMRDEDDVVQNLAAYTKVKGGKTKVRHYPLPHTGPYFVRVSDPLGRTGQYSLKTKGKLTDVPGVPEMTLNPGETYEVPFGAGPGLFVNVKIKLASSKLNLSVLSVHDPRGEEVPHAVASFLKLGRKIRGTLLMRSPARSIWRDDADSRRVGEYGLTLGGATAPTRFKVKVKVQHAKAKGTRVVASTLPVITGVEPDFGRPGASVVVHGENFLPGKLDVLFGDKRGLDATYLTPQTIGVRVPSDEGLVDVTVLNSDGQEGTLEDAFQFIPNPPAVASVAPDVGPDSGGTVVDIYGKAFSFAETVAIGGTVLSTPPTLVADFQLRITTEPMAPGTYSIVVTDKFGQVDTLPDAFTFVAAPVLLGLSPSTGGGGRTITCIGQNFRADDEVLINGEVTESTYLSASAITWTSPAGDPGDKLTVTVRDPWGRESTLVDAYEYRLSTGLIEETFSNNDHEDTDFVPVGAGGLARWNATATPGLLNSTFGNTTVNAPFTPAVSTGANSFPLGTYNSGKLRVQNWMKSSEVGSAGTITGLYWVPSSNYSGGPKLGNFTVLIGHNTSTTGMTSLTHLSNFSSTPTTVINNVTYTVPTMTSSSPCAFPTFTTSFNYNGSNSLVIDVQKQSYSGSVSSWKNKSDITGRRVYQNSGVGPTATAIDGYAYCYYLDFRNETSMAQSTFYRAESAYPAFLDPIVEPTTYPAGTEVTIEYQGADAHIGTGDPDPLTYTDWTEDPKNLENHLYIRFRVTFKANLVTATGPHLDRIIIPYEYFD